MGGRETREPARSQRPARTVKCLVWDLDNTLWDGVLLEDEQVSLREGVVGVVRTLDDRGILQSIASRCDHAAAMAKLGEFGLAEYFLYPQINWGSKVPSIKVIAQSLNIGLDSIALVDDQAFERDEVRFSLPQVLCFDPGDIDELLDLPEMTPRFITADSRLRRTMYQSDMVRREAEQNFSGHAETFLASLGMVLTIFQAGEADLQRAEELTTRTNQLNSTGYTYSYQELSRFTQSDRHRLLMSRLEDTYGTYGHIGLALIECRTDVWVIKLLLTSCRVMSRGVGAILLSHVMQQAKRHNVRLRAEFVPTGRNRLMNIAYRFAGFREAEQIGDLVVFESDLTDVQPFPEYVQVRVMGGTS